MESVRVRLDHRATPEEVDAVRQAFEEAGIDADVDGGYEKSRPGEAWGEGDEPEWLTIIYVTAITGFIGGFAAAAGKDAWEGLKRVAEQIRDSRKKNPPYQGSIQIHDTDRQRAGLEVIVGWAYDLDVSDDAWRTLLELDWASLPARRWLVVQWFEVDQTWRAYSPSIEDEPVDLRWDRARGRWV